MTRRSIIWRVVATLFIVLNLGGAMYAAVKGEFLHTLTHAALLLLTVWLVWRFALRRTPNY